MKSIYPWSEDVEKLFRRLAKDRIVYTDNSDFTRSLGRKYPGLFDEDNGFLDIGRIKKRRSSVIVLRPGNGIAPKPCRKKYMQFDFFKIY